MYFKFEYTIINVLYVSTIPPSYIIHSKTISMSASRLAMYNRTVLYIIVIVYRLQVKHNFSILIENLWGL